MSEKIMAFRGDYQFLSNMYSASFEWDGRTYRNSEAAFQSAKTLDAEERDSFSEMNGVVAKRAGKKVLLRKDWEIVKDGIMEEVVRAKFSQNPDLLEKLISTGDAELVEGNRWHDKYWGYDLISNEGENHLGMILMKIRAELGGAEYLEKAKLRKEEREAEEKGKRDALLAEVRDIQSQLAVIPDYDFTGMTFATKAFGKVTIKKQEGEYLHFDAMGKEKVFVLPGCIVQGFLTPDDPTIAENYKLMQKLNERLQELRKEAVKTGIDIGGAK